MSERVYRPLGLTIAIMAGVVLFGVWPLTKFYIAYRLNADVDDGGLIFGSSLPFDTLIQATAVVGVLVILSAVFAWIGRPASIQYMFQVIILLSAFLLIGEAIYRTTQETTGINSSFQSGDATAEDILRCQVPLQILTALYIIWYCNRAPARAFYRQEPATPYNADETEI